MLKNLFIITSLFFTLLHSEELKDVSLQLNWKFQFEYAGFIVAKEKGFYKDVGIDLELKEFKQGTVVVDDVLQNKADFGVSDSAVILKSIQGAPIVGVMSIFQHSPFILLGLKSSGIETIKDLNNKNIAILEDTDGITILSMLKSNNIKYKSHPKVFDFEKLISKEIDMISSYATNEIFVAKEKGLDIITFNPRDYGFDSYGDILLTSKETIKKHPKMVQNFYDATKKGWDYAFENIDETVELIFKNYNSLQKSKEALLFEANELKKNSGHGKNFGELNLEKLKAMSNLYSFLISDKYDIANLQNFIYDRSLPNDNLTPKEREYIQNNTFTYAGDPNWLPFEAFDKQGKYIGIISEHIDIVEKKLNIKFKKIITKDWSETLELSKNAKPDIISGDAADVVLARNYQPIDTYIQNPLVIITRDDYPFISDLNHMKDKKIAYIDGYGYTADIVKKYPNIDFIKTSSIDTALFGVKSGEYDIFIGTLSMVDYTIINMGIEGIKISGDTDITMNLTLFINKNKPQLYTIINKAMHSIDDITKIKIISKWRQSTIEKVVVDYTLVWQIVGVFIFLLLIGLLFVMILRKNNKKLNQLLNSTIEAVAIFKNGRLIEANKQCLKMYGYTSLKDIKGNSPLDFVSPSQHNYLKSQLKNSHEPYELDMIKADGRIFPSLIRGTQIDKNIRISSVIDLTELKNTQKKLEELNQTLELKVKDEVEKNKQQQLLMLHQSRLAQMGEMISMIAHQWRQPLNNLSLIIQGASLKYKLGKFNDTQMLKLSNDSKKQISQMSQTIDDFRYFFKPDKDAKEFSVNAAILHTLTLLKPALEQEDIVVETYLEEEILIKGFSNELGQVLINILNNAKDALVENNSVKKKCITIVLKKDNDKAVISIEDNAGGIADDVIDQIFNPYFSTKEEKNGTGLGLYMSKSIIEGHSNGILSVENSSNGAIFKIILGG